MKKLGFVVFAAALIVGLVVSNLIAFGRVSDKFFNFSFNFKGVKGSGTAASEKRELNGFHAVEVGGIFHVEITAQKDFGVEVEADDNLLRYIKTEVRGGKLSIEMDKKVSSKHTMKIRISAPDIDELEVSGAANVTVNDLKNTGINVDSSGASKIKIAGETAKLIVDVSGATKVDAGDLKSENATVEASGASHVDVNVTGQLRADASGASKIVYSGSPANVEKKSSGASHISPK
ncbi:MAG TPA: head GIN domain-containing protein [Pyrinomonadaceae bacterium]|nr:head GIN domain-containing protein [Pyrinomonadaceae bacterium]